MHPSQIRWQIRDDYTLRNRVAATLAATAAYVTAEDPKTPGHWERALLATTVLLDPLKVVTTFVAEVAANPTLATKAKAKTTGAPGAAEQVDTSDITDDDLTGVVSAAWTDVARRIIGDTYVQHRG